MKTNLKQYQNKKRIYLSVPNCMNISRVYHWNGNEYLGGNYEARKSCNGSRLKETFSTIEAARNWLFGSLERNQTESAINKGRNFGEIISEWKKRTFPTIEQSTQWQYEKVLNGYILPLARYGIYEITPKFIDEWIDDLKDPNGRGMRSKNRKSFEHELTLLTAILRYYEEYSDDPAFKLPIKRRHRDAIKLAISKKPLQKDIPEEEFLIFLEQFAHIKNGDLYRAMATVQFYQALRISEVAAIEWESLRFDQTNPESSRLRITKSVIWPRKKNLVPFVKLGFKNSKFSSGLKELPLFYQAYQVLRKMKGDQPRQGLVFQVDGKVVGYRSIQHAFDRAFQLAGLPYSATHVMRHGGTSRVYNLNGDASIAQQILGNKDIKTTMIYSHRKKSALTEVAQKEWAQLESAAQEQTLLANVQPEGAIMISNKSGRKWSHEV